MPDDRETARHAITAFVWAVLGFGFLPLIGTALAFVYAGRADRMIDRYPHLRGRELAASARSLAAAQLVFYVLLAAVAIGVAFAFADAIRDLEAETVLD
jgi:4-hydroxybenzoate polyprenyltransferase